LFNSFINSEILCGTLDPDLMTDIGCSGCQVVNKSGFLCFFEFTHSNTN